MYDESCENCDDLKMEITKLRKSLGDLVFHCIDYNIVEESLVLAMEIEKAREALK